MILLTKKVDKKIRIFLLFYGKRIKRFFFYAAILGLLQKLEMSFEGDLTNDIIETNETAQKLLQIKDDLTLNLNLDTFNNQCYKINEILTEKNFFLRLCEKRKKIQYLICKPPSGKNTVIRAVSSCVIDRYNGYDIVKMEQRDCIRHVFKPINIVYDPVDNPSKIIECYFTDNIRLKYSRGKRKDTMSFL